jgi:NAD(P)-dependent dehydrogenase (short-subunit alcohol dehydrogenase family)
MGDTDDLTLKNSLVVVTGAGRGIGAAIASKLAGMGAITMLCGRTRGPLESTAAAISKVGGRAEIAECDVTDIRSVEAVAAHADRTFGRVDILVNNAGIGGFGGPLHQMPVESWNQVLNTNLRGVYYCIRAFAPMMIRARRPHHQYLFTCRKKSFAKWRGLCRFQMGIERIEPFRRRGTAGP